jgi:hypothetical protein
MALFGDLIHLNNIKKIIWDVKRATHARTHIFFLSKEKESKVKMVEANAAKNNMGCRFLGELMH